MVDGVDDSREALECVGVQAGKRITGRRPMRPDRCGAGSKPFEAFDHRSGQSFDAPRGVSLRVEFPDQVELAVPHQAGNFKEVCPGCRRLAVQPEGVQPFGRGVGQAPDAEVARVESNCPR